MLTVSYLLLLLAVLILACPPLPPPSRWVAFALAATALIFWLLASTAVRLG